VGVASHECVRTSRRLGCATRGACAGSALQRGDRLEKHPSVASNSARLHGAILGTAAVHSQALVPNANALEVELLRVREVRRDRGGREASGLHGSWPSVTDAALGHCSRGRGGRFLLKGPRQLPFRFTEADEKPTRLATGESAADSVGRIGRRALVGASHPRPRHLRSLHRPRHSHERPGFRVSGAPPIAEPPMRVRYPN
jgi:hypothetical protein